MINTVQDWMEILITQNHHVHALFHITPYGYAQVHRHVITWCQLKAFPCSALFKSFMLSHHIKVDIRVHMNIRRALRSSSSLIVSVKQSDTLQWRHNDHGGVSNHQHQAFMHALNKENIKAPRHWPLGGEFTGTGEFRAQRTSNAENVSIWWRHHEISFFGNRQRNNPCFLIFAPSL